MPENETVDVFAGLKPEDFRKTNTADPVAPVAPEVKPESEPAPEPEKVETKAAPVEKQEEVKSGTETQPATTTTEPAKQETKTEVKPVTPKPADWKNELKKIDRDEALKELGLDEFEIGLLKYRKETGDVTPYLEAKTVDFSKLSDEEIMRRDLKSQYPALSDEEFDLLYQDEVADRFKLDTDSWDEAQTKIGRLKLKVEADKARKRMIEEQKRFAAPERQKEEVKPDDSAQRFAEIQRDWEEFVTTNEATKKLQEVKRLELGGKDNPFNYEVDDPIEAAASAMDNTKFWALFNTEAGTDLNKFYRIREYAKNPEKFEKALIDYGKSLGRKAEIDELKNPSKPDLGKPHDETTGDFYNDIGQAFLKNGVKKSYQ